MSAGALWERLRAEGLVEGERPEAGRSATPWYLRAILGIAGWLGAMFLIGSLGIGFAFVMESSVGAIVLGTILCAIAGALFAKFDGAIVVEQFALAISLVGQMAIVAGIAIVLPPEKAPLYLAIAAVEGVLALLVANFLHRVLATSGAAVAIALAIYLLELHGLSAPLISAGLMFVWLEPKRWAGDGALWRPIGYGLVLALLLVEAFRLFGGGALVTGGETGAPGLAYWGPWIGRTLVAALLVWLAAALCRREGAAPGSRAMLAAVGAAALFALVSVAAPGLGSAMLILLLGFSVGNRILMALGILGLLGFVSHFYYSLHATLLEKSGLLALSGVLLLGGCLLLKRSTAAAPETADA